MRFPWYTRKEIDLGLPRPAPLLAQLLDSTPYAITAAVGCVMLAIVVSILATKKKRLAARPKVKRCGSYEGKVVTRRSASCGAG